MTTSKKGYSDMLKNELLVLAKRLGLTNLSRLRKDEIIVLIKKATRKRMMPPVKPTAKKAATSKRSKRATTPKATKKATSKKAVKPRAVRPKAVAQGSQTSSAVSYRPEELQSVDEDLQDLPRAQNENRIVLMPRDPAWLLAYWNLTDEYTEAARAAGGTALWVRLYDVTDHDFEGSDRQVAFEQAVAEWSRSWYLPVPVPCREYLVEIGYRGGKEWFPLARSKSVWAPTDQPSDQQDDRFATIGFDEELKVAKDRLPELSGQALSPAAQDEKYTLIEEDDLRIVMGRGLFSPSGVPHWPLFSYILLRAAVGIPGSLGQIPGSLGQIPGSLGQIPGSLGQIPGSLGHPWEDLGGAAAGHPRWSPGVDQAPVVLEDAHRPMLQARVELVISGQAFPNTDVSVAGHPIPVDPDGAFSMRVSVPDGMRVVPIEACSRSSRQIRRLTLRFGREFE